MLKDKFKEYVQKVGTNKDTYEMAQDLSDIAEKEIDSYMQDKMDNYIQLKNKEIKIVTDINTKLYLENQSLKERIDKLTEKREGMTELEYWKASSEGHRKSATKYLNKYLEAKSKLYKLEQKLIDCHNKNTELKGDIGNIKWLDEEEVDKIIESLLQNRINVEHGICDCITGNPVKDYLLQLEKIGKNAVSSICNLAIPEKKLDRDRMIEVLKKNIGFIKTFVGEKMAGEYDVGLKEDKFIEAIADEILEDK